MGILIRETTREQRERIVSESIGNTDGLCDGCACGILEMYQPYIDGLIELREINEAFVRNRCLPQARSGPEADPADARR